MYLFIIGFLFVSLKKFPFLPVIKKNKGERFFFAFSLECLFTIQLLFL